MPTSTQRFRLVGDDDASRAFLEVAAAARLLKSNMDDVGSSVFGLAKLSGGASLIPVLAGTTAAVTELTTSLAAAGGAGGVFGLSVVGQVKAMVKQRKAIATTDTSLSRLTKGTTAYHDTLVKLHDQQRAFQQDFGPAAKGLDDMSSAWDKFLKATSPVTNGVLADGFDLVTSVLPKLVPVSNAAGRAVGGLIDDLQHWTEGPSFAHLLHFLETSGPKDITRFGHSIGNVLGGLGGILSNFVGPGDHAAKSLEHLTKDFDKWGHSKGVSDSVDRFLRYVGDNGPQISEAFRSLASAAPKIATSLGQLGSANLSVTSRFLNLIAGMPQGAFNIVVDGLFGIAAASKAITAVTGIRALLTGFSGVASGKGLAGKLGGGALGGVQKVFVVNPGFGGGGGEGGLLGDAKKGIPLLGGLSAGTAAAWAVAGAGVGLAAAKGFQLANKNALLDGPFGLNTLADHIGSGVLHIGPKESSVAIKALKATGTEVDALNSRLSKSSQAIDLVGHSANRAFNGTAPKAITNTTAKLQAINGVKGEQAFDLIGTSAAKNSALAGRNIDVLTGKIKDIPDKRVRVSADVSAALARIASVHYQVDQLHDKTIIIRATGGHVPGEPTSRGGGGTSGGGGDRGLSPRSSSRSGSGNSFNITVQAAPGERLTETIPRALSILDLIYGG